MICSMATVQLLWFVFFGCCLVRSYIYFNTKALILLVRRKVGRLARLVFPRPGGRLGQRDARLQVSLSPRPAHVPRRRPAFSAPDQAHGRHEVDEELARVELRRDAELTGRVVEGVFVVPVVPA